MSTLSCRFYKNKLPKVDDVVMVVVRSVADIGAYVNLLEYNNLEGMILLSELSRRRIRSVNKLIRVGKTESVLVIRVDKDKRYIDLSKKRVSLEEVRKCEERFIRAKTLYHIVLHSAQVLGKNNEEFEAMMEDTVWRFDEKYKSSGGAYETFRRILREVSILDETNLDEEAKKVLLDSIKHRLEPRKVKIRADIEVASYSYEGIDAVKASLMAGLQIQNESVPIKINLIAPPIYVVSSTVLDRDEGLKHVQLVVDTIKEEIIARDGHFNIKMGPKIVTDVEEAELARQMAELDRANQDVDGDDDSEEESTSETEIENDLSTSVKAMEVSEN